MLDTDILIEIQRQTPEALDWLNSLPEEPSVCSFAALELLLGSRDAKERKETEELLEEFDLLFPTIAGLRMAFGISALKLSHGLSGFDALIAATALEHDVTLYTFNRKHFGAVPGLKVIVPYMK